MFWKVPCCDIYDKVPKFLKNIKISVAILWKADSVDKWIWENHPLKKKKRITDLFTTIHLRAFSMLILRISKRKIIWCIRELFSFFNVTNESLHSFPFIYLNKPYFATCSFSLVSKHFHLPIFIKGKEVNTSSATINTLVKRARNWNYYFHCRREIWGTDGLSDLTKPIQTVSVILLFESFISQSEGAVSMIPHQTTSRSQTPTLCFRLEKTTKPASTTTFKNTGYFSVVYIFHKKWLFMVKAMI